MSKTKYILKGDFLVSKNTQIISIVVIIVVIAIVAAVIGMYYPAGQMSRGRYCYWTTVWGSYIVQSSVIAENSSTCTWTGDNYDAFDFGVSTANGTRYRDTCLSSRNMREYSCTTVAGLDYLKTTEGDCTLGCKGALTKTLGEGETLSPESPIDACVRFRKVRTCSEVVVSIIPFIH